MKIRSLMCALLLLAACDKVPAPQESFAGLGSDAGSTAQVLPGKVFSSSEDHGPHDGFRIEWWYVTANLKDACGNVFGAQWTLFRVTPQGRAVQAGWHDSACWPGSRAVTSATRHYAAERFACGGVGQAGAQAARSTPGLTTGISPVVRRRERIRRRCNWASAEYLPTTCT